MDADPDMNQLRQRPNPCACQRCHRSSAVRFPVASGNRHSGRARIQSRCDQAVCFCLQGPHSDQGPACLYGQARWVVHMCRGCPLPVEHAPLMRRALWACAWPRRRLATCRSEAAGCPGDSRCVDRTECRVGARLDVMYRAKRPAGSAHPDGHNPAGAPHIRRAARRRRARPRRC